MFFNKKDKIKNIQKHLKSNYFLHFRLNEMEPTELEKSFPAIDFGEEFSKAKQELFNFEIATSRLKAIINDGDFFLNEYFVELRTQLDLERESSKLQIDDYFDQLIQELFEMEKACKKKKTVEKYQENIIKFDNDLKRLNQEINKPKVDVYKWSRIKFESLKKMEETNLIIENYQNELLKNQLISIGTIQNELEALLDDEDMIKIKKVPSSNLNNSKNFIKIVYFIIFNFNSVNNKTISKIYKLAISL